MAEMIAVLVTTKDEAEAAQVARALVEERLAACGNIVPKIRSIYRWKDAVEDGAESLLILKTRAELFEPLRARVLELHSYDCPEVIQLEVGEAHEPYLQWVLESVG